MDEANEKKLRIYQKVVDNSRRKGWRARCEPLEVGRGRFAGQSLCRVFTALASKAKRKANGAVNEATEKATKWLWFKRAEL